MACRPHPVPDRRQQPDVPRLPRDPRADAVRRQVHQRRLRLRHDAAEAAGGSPAGVHRRVVRPARPRRSATTARRPTTRPIARRCRAISPSRCRGSTKPAKRWACPILTVRRLRGRRRDRHAGDRRRGAPASSVAIVTGDKDFFQLVGDGIRVYNPRDEGAWYDAAGVQREVRRAAVDRSWTCSR